MKKQLEFFFLLFIISGLTACSDKEDKIVNPVDTKPELSFEHFSKGLLKQIAVSKNGTIMGVGTNDHVFKLNAAGNDWDEPTTTARLTQVSVASDGTTWGINNENKIFKWTGVEWQVFEKGLLKNISVGKDGLVWGVGTNDHVFRLNAAGNDWEEPSPTGRLTQVSVASDGTAWGINNENKIFKWTGTDWQVFENGLLKNISVGKNGLVWGIGTNNHVFRLSTDGKTWEEPIATALLTQVSVGSDGTIWGVNGSNEIFKLVTK